MKISQSAFDLIVAEEVTSQAYYIRHYQNPEWPGGMSGVTIAIGYDLGYASADKIRSDWAAHVDAAMLQVMISCAGVRGTSAANLLGRVKPLISIPWPAAIAVFSMRDIPHWTAVVLQSIPAASKLTSTCLGVIVSLAYNRGASFDLPQDRYSEMRDIKRDITRDMLPNVADDLRSMKRLWPSLRGVRDRRDHEAALWMKGLTTIEPTADVGDAQIDPKVGTAGGRKRTKPPATTTAQNTTTGSIVVGGVVAANAAHHAEMITAVTAIGIIVCALIVGAALWTVWYRNRNPN